MNERLKSGTRSTHIQKWRAASVSEERRNRLRELGFGDSDDDISASLHLLEATFDLLPRGTMRFREMPTAKYREIAIRVQDVREHRRVIESLQNAGLFPWYSNEDGLEIVISHPSDLAIIDSLGLSAIYEVEQYAPHNRPDEPEILVPLREKLEREAREGGAAPLRKSSFVKFVEPRSPEQLKNVDVHPAPKDLRVRERSVRRAPSEELLLEGDLVEVDEFLRDAVDRFDLGISEEDRARALDSARVMPSLALFPRKYIWDKEERKLFRAHSGSEVTPGQQHRLNMTAKNDPRAMQECVRMHIGVVLWALPAMLRKYPHMDPDDLFQAGLLGLVKVLNRYGTDESEQERLDIEKEEAKKREKKNAVDTDRVRKGWVSYMLYYIEAEMRQAAQESARYVTRTGHIANNRSTYYKTLTALRAAHPERSVNRAELREALHRIGAIKSPTDHALDRFERKYFIAAFFSPDTVEVDSEAYGHVVDMTAAPVYESDSTNDYIADSQRRAAVIKALQTLTPREERVIRMRFGLIGRGRYDEDMTLEEVGNTIGTQKERVRQIEAKALRKLKHPSRSNQLLKAFSGQTYRERYGK